MPTFDGDNLIITLDAGITDVDVYDDILTDWKDWMLAHPDHRKVPYAFLSDGGKPLTSIINQGSYVFLNNTAGWRIRPPEEHITIYLVGNLAVDDTALPALTPTVGAYTTAVLGLQPVTQGVTPEMKKQLEYGSYQNAVWVDGINGFSAGQYLTLGVSNPGSRQYPYNNEPDALAEAATRGLDTIGVIGDFAFSGDIAGFTIVGQNPVKSNITINDIAVATGVEIFESHVKGVLDGGTTARECLITDLNYVNGYIEHCVISPGTITLGGSSAFTAHFLDCKSGQPGVSTPVIDCAGDGPALALRGYDGGIKLINKTGASSVSIDLSAGQVIVDIDQITPANSTVTGGTIVVRGDGKIVDANGEHLLSGTYGGVIIVNETTSVPHDHTLTAITDAVWADSKALTVPKFVGLK